ncbi:MAG TPA: thiamine pyrophosphate-dependent enzyme, partial [Vicinamibacterales bacterium]|nr:thiamine pyrophosphate-dependent enzyme [Vicinamibacterales bacterium]
MSKTVESGSLTGLAGRFGAFVAERYPFVVTEAVEAFDAAVGRAHHKGSDAAAIDALRPALGKELASRLSTAVPAGLAETTPGVTAKARLAAARDEFVEACDGFLRRASIAASLTPDERREILRGMILTRATDSQLKAFFSGGEVRYEGISFQGKGFRSLGQEAIYAGGIRLRRGPKYRGADGTWQGDVIAPVIRDIGIALAMRPEPESVRMVLSAQMGKAGPPLDGRDLHVGDFAWGILPAAAPLAVGTVTMAGMAMGFGLDGSGRVAFSFIGEGGSSLGEWHEAINLCAARRLPAVFCLQNNQTALSTPVSDQSAVRVFADKAIGYGIPGITIDGTDPDAVAAAFTWAAERARAGLGPALIELISMRMCGHAHHDDMLYLGHDPKPGWDYPALTEQGYANRELYEFWRTRDPIPAYAARLEAEGLIEAGELDRMKAEAERIVYEQARAVIDAPWPEPASAAVGVFADEAPRYRVEVLEPERRVGPALGTPLPALDPGAPFDPKGNTFLDAV